jgi:hypothetical protein
VGLGTAEVNPIMQVATAGADFHIVVDRPLMRTDTAKVTKVFETTLVETLPMRSRDQVHTQLVNQVPGGMNGRIAGGTEGQTIFLQDGFELNQSNGVYPVLKSVDAVEIGVSGYGAEGATAPGGMLNVVTRSGSNRLEAELEATADSSRLRFFTDQRDAAAPSFYYLLAPLVSGPILKDRLWFMATDELHFIQNARPADAEGLLRAADTYRKFIHKGTLKLTWQMTTRHRLSSLTNLEFPIWEHNMITALGTESDAQQDRYARRLFTGLVYDALLTDQLVLRAQAGLMQIPQEWYPTRCRTDPNCDFVPSVLQTLPRRQALQNNPGHRRDDLLSVQWMSSLQWFPQRPFLGKHDVAVKERFYTEENTQRISRPGDRTYEYAGSTPMALTTYYANDPRYDQARYGWYISTAHVLRHTTTLSDAWKPTNFLTVTPSLSHTFAGGSNSRGDRLVNSQALAPGLTLAWDATHDGRTVVRASHSQYVDVDLLAAARHTLGSQAQQRCLWNPDSQSYDRSCVFSGGLSRNTFGSPCGPSGLDTEGRPCRQPLGIPRTFEYGLGVEREFAGLATSLDLIHRRYSHQFEVSETNRIWSDSGNAVLGYRNGRPEAILDLGTPASATRQYTGVTLGLTRRQGRFKGMASYTWSTLTGNVFDNLNNPWGDIPARDVYLRGGPLADDHRHEVRASLQFQPCNLLTLGGRYEFSSGTPVQRLFWNEETASFDLYRARAGQNPGANLNDPGDDRSVRLPDRQELNVEVRVNLQPLLGQRLELAVDLLNLLGSRTATALGQNDGQDAGVERAWMDPFRVRLRASYRY